MWVLFKLPINILYEGVILYFNPLPRKEGDQLITLTGKCGTDFNPLPRKEGDGCTAIYTLIEDEFQSTPS